ncbi:L-alanine-DL-glutamate epimerase-like enolase superfamily enzyme [Sphingomonas sp. UYAg733]
MNDMKLDRLTLSVSTETLPFTEPFHISGYIFNDSPVIVATLSCNGVIGRGEASGVYYRSQTCATMVAEIEAHRSALEQGITRRELLSVMVPGGARNAIDCALWELEARQKNIPVWKLAGLSSTKPLLTTFTLSADEPERMVSAALKFGDARALKLKLTGQDVATDAERVRAVRAAFPGIWIAVDANQGFTPKTLDELLPTLIDARIALLEQPFAIGREADMEGLELPFPTAADESVQGLTDIDALVGKFDIINIKLDKCGGLTEALDMEQRARALGLGVMVGNMIGSSWAMAPAFIVGQNCDVVDLDGPVYMARDREPCVSYHDGFIDCPEAVWGSSEHLSKSLTSLGSGK